MINAKPVARDVHGTMWLKKRKCTIQVQIRCPSEKRGKIGSSGRRSAISVNARKGRMKRVSGGGGICTGTMRVAPEGGPVDDHARLPHAKDGIRVGMRKSVRQQGGMPTTRAIGVEDITVGTTHQMASGKIADPRDQASETQKTAAAAVGGTARILGPRMRDERMSLGDGGIGSGRLSRMRMRRIGNRGDARRMKIVIVIGRQDDIKRAMARRTPTTPTHPAN